MRAWDLRSIRRLAAIVTTFPRLLDGGVNQVIPVARACRSATADQSVDVSDEASPDDRTMATRPAKSEAFPDVVKTVTGGWRKSEAFELVKSLPDTVAKANH